MAPFQPLNAAATLASALLLALTAAAPADAADPQAIAPVALPPPWTDPVAMVALYPLPGQPMDVVAADAQTGYISLDMGGILRYQRPGPDGGDLQVSTVVDDLVHGRGIALRDGVLYVVELGPLPCVPEKALCEGFDFPPGSPQEGELAILDAMRARVLAFDIAPDGSLSGRRTVISDLPVVSSLHAANGLEVGPDGWLYLAVGSVDRLWRQPERVEGHTPHPEWLGTVLRFDGTGAAPEVVASGIRNMYELTFDDTGRIWGVDNDGYTQGGWLWEEILQVKPGHHYGYPQDGTFGPATVRDDPAAWTSQTAGSAGIAWAGDVGMGSGLLIGDCGHITLLTPDPTWQWERWEEGLIPRSQRSVYDGVGGCVTSIEPVGWREILATSYGDETGTLVYLRFVEPVAPSGGPATPQPRWNAPG